MADNLKSDLQAVRDLLADPERWTQGALARDAHGLSTLGITSESTCFCLMGALYKLHPYGGDAFFNLEQHLAHSPALDGDSSYAHYNDTHTHAEVLALLDERINALA